jgi:hypothetical protein
MRLTKKDLKEVVEGAKQDISSWDDERLSAAADRAYDIMVQALRAVPFHPKGPKVSLPEIILWETWYDNHRGMFELPSPRGGKVKDHLPPDYRGLTIMVHSPFVYLKELGWNLLPHDIPVEVKLGIAARKMADALKMHEAPGGNTPENFVRLLVAEAQFALLHGWEEKLNRPRPKMTRQQMIDALASFFEFAVPALARRKAVQ